MQLIVHLGLHRCASTALQNRLRRGAKVAAKAKRENAPAPFQAITPKEIAATPFAGLNRLGKPDSFDNTPQSVAEAILTRLDEDRARGDLTIVSDENIPGFMLGKAARFAERLDRVLTCLQLIAASVDTKAVLFVREPVSYLESIYRFRVAKGFAAGFTSFLDTIELDTVDFSKLIAKLQDGLGDSNVLIHAFDSGDRKSFQLGLKKFNKLAGRAVFDKQSARRVAGSLNPLTYHLLVVFGQHGVYFMRKQQEEMAALLAKLNIANKSEMKKVRQHIAELARQRAIRLPLQISPLKSLTFDEVAENLDHLSQADCEVEELDFAALFDFAIRTYKAYGSITDIPDAMRQMLVERVGRDWKAIAQRYM